MAEQMYTGLEQPMIDEIFQVYAMLADASPHFISKQQMRANQTGKTRYRKPDQADLQAKACQTEAEEKVCQTEAEE